MGEFERILRKAINGDRKEIAHLISIYSPIIDRKSIVDGHIDEDLRQYLLMELIFSLPKFNGLEK